MKKAGLILLALVLALAAGLQFRDQAAVSPGKGKHLAQVLPSNPGSWVGQDVPLGPTEAVQGAVEKTLRYDDVYFREFKSSRGIISLYVGYWAPGKMPTQLVASHTPDRCWVENGWTCVETRHNDRLASTGAGLRAGEWRIFSAPHAQRLHVEFWHLVGPEVYDYGERTSLVPSVWRWWRDAAQQAFKSPPEQYFIRLTSERPFAELKGDPGWEEMLAALAKLGLAAPPAARNLKPES